MSDRSYVSITFYDCPPTIWTAVLDLLRDNIDVDDVLTTYPPDDAWPITIIDEEVHLGYMAESLANVAALAAQHLVSDGPVIFWGEQSPDYDSYGDRSILVEEGYSHVETDGAGHVPLPLDLVHSLVANNETACDLYNHIFDLTGQRYFAAAREWEIGTRTRQHIIHEAPDLKDVLA